MAFARNLTLFHRLFDMAPGLGGLALRGAGLVAGMPNRLAPGLHCVYLHGVPVGLQDCFVAALRELAKEARFIDTAELPQAAADLARPTIHLSFDDGVSDNHVLGRKLAAAGLPALFFVLPGYIEQPPSGRGYYWEIPPGQGLMNWQQISELAKLGHTIGSHAMWHNRFTDLDEAASVEEMSRSKTMIEERLGCRVEALSFPFGRRTDFRPEQVTNAWRLGYRFAFTTISEPPIAMDGGWQIGRTGIDYRLGPAALRVVINGLLTKLSIIS
jgi:peptidoglycan/xylan/chitin deacetylase (PgdA/CDA1 family)